MTESIAEFVKRIGVPEENDLGYPGTVLTVNDKRYSMVAFTFRAIEDLRERVQALEDKPTAQHEDKARSDR